MRNVFFNPIREAHISWDDITKKLERVRNRHFVYLLLNKRDVVYVGMTSNLYGRLVWHKYRKQFNSVYLIEYQTIYKCSNAEKSIIKYYSPELNIRSK